MDRGAILRILIILLILSVAVQPASSEEMPVSIIPIVAHTPAGSEMDEFHVMKILRDVDVIFAGPRGAALSFELFYLLPDAPPHPSGVVRGDMVSEARSREPDAVHIFFVRSFPEGEGMVERVEGGLAIFVSTYRDRVAEALAHELGHALGLEHADDPGNLMWPNVGTQTGANLTDEQVSIIVKSGVATKFRLRVSEDGVRNGDFSLGPAFWLKGVSREWFGGFLAPYGLSYPLLRIAVDESGDAYLCVDAPEGSSGYFEQAVKLSKGMKHTLNFTVWGQLDAVVAYVVIVDEAGEQRVLDGFIPPQVEHGLRPLKKSYDLSPFTSQTVKVRFHVASAYVEPGSSRFAAKANFDDISVESSPIESPPTGFSQPETLALSAVAAGIVSASLALLAWHRLRALRAVRKR